ncbi:DUF3696 domain-containing protein [Pirellulaceae bacterium SH449]
MITGITIQNFKGIRDPVKLEFRPITLLFGANSAGKSTILHALHYGREVFERHNLDADETIAGGKYIDLGGYKRLVHRDEDESCFNPDTLICLRIDVQITEHDLKSFYPDIDGLIARTLADIGRYRDDLQSSFEDITWLSDFRFASLFTDIKSTSVELEIGWSKTLNRPFVSKNTIFFNDEPFIVLEANEQNRGVVARFSTSDTESQKEGSTLNHQCLRRASEHYLERGKLPLDDSSLLQILLDNCDDLLSFQKYQIDLDDLEDALPPLDDVLFFSPAAISPNGDPEHDFRHAFHINLSQEIVIALSQYIIGPCKLIRECLKDFRYLGPLRETPPRNYAPPRFHDPARWASGLGAWDVLNAASDELVEEVGSWLGDENKLRSGCAIQRRNSASFDYSHPLIRKMISGRAFDEVEADWSLDLSQTETVSRIVVVSDAGIELHPHEVGIGISQVVPVIVTALDDAARLLAIEQPELHIHPRLQAEVADLFIESIHKKKHRVIIETHSEHLILRLLRRIRETEKDKAPPHRTLRTDDIAIYYLKQTEGTSQALQIEVDVKGEFIQPWPDDFFDIDFYERFTTGEDA